MNFSKNIFHSRQLIIHKWVTVNGKKVNIPSYTLKKGDIIQISTTVRSKLLNILKNKSLKKPPCYLHVNNKILSGIYLRSPFIQEINYPFKVNVRFIRGLK